jgi:hypothetical protein
MSGVVEFGAGKHGSRVVRSGSLLFVRGAATYARPCLQGRVGEGLLLCVCCFEKQSFRADARVTFSRMPERK